MKYMHMDSSPVFFVDMSVLANQIKRWKQNLPTVQPLYAMKANFDAKICQTLVEHDIGMEVASKLEMQKSLEMGVPKTKILFGAPMKEDSHLVYAKENGVMRCVADSKCELNKIAKLHPESEVFMRIAVDDREARCRFSSKFGLFREEWPLFLQHAKERRVNLCGVSFHVGSGGSSPLAFFDAISLARDAFDAAKEYGFQFKNLDIGGGFSDDSKDISSFEDVATAINVALENLFPQKDDVQFYAEPGRFFVASSHTYAVSVIGKRDLLPMHHINSHEIEKTGLENSTASAGDDAEVAVWINDGLYGCFNCCVFDHAEAQPVDYVLADPKHQHLKTKVFGPTCDSIDVVISCATMPCLEQNDIILFKNMGAYTRSSSSRFNGYGYFRVVYLNSD